MTNNSKNAKEPTEEKIETGWLEIEFLKDFGSYKKGDTATYHFSTVDKLINKEKAAKIVKRLTKFVPAKAEK